MERTLWESSRKIPVVDSYDLCVVGGSCTGVFAAVRAAEMGLKVAIVEQFGFFGGAATAAQVNEWHSLCDIFGRIQIINGLTSEVLSRLRSRGAVLDGRKRLVGECYRFNSAELVLELDELVASNGIRPFLLARCVEVTSERGRVESVIIEDKSGRRALKASVFIDATGDGDIARRAGFSCRKPEVLQPANYQMLVAGLDSPEGVWEAVKELAISKGYPSENSNPWISPMPGIDGVKSIFGPRMNGVDGSDADAVSRALIEGRRYHRILHDAVRETFGYSLAALSPAVALGVRESWHIDCEYQIRGEDLLSGREAPDAIARGTYPVDIHSIEGTVLRSLSGEEQIVFPDGSKVDRRWREEGSEFAYYTIPYRSMVPLGSENLLVAGRIIDADTDAFGAVRVMVNANQTGEAAGVAAAISLAGAAGKVSEIDASELQRKLWG